MRYTIRIQDLEVFCRVGVPDEERAEPQRLLVTVELEVDAPRAARSDDLQDTIDYFNVSRDVLEHGAGGSWKLIETLSADLAERLLEKYQPVWVGVEVKKFIIPEARYISVACRRGAAPD
jgi:FolB domain-containing protein